MYALTVTKIEDEWQLTDNWTEQRVRLFITLYNDGYPYEAIGRMLGITGSAVWQKAKRLGMTRIKKKVQQPPLKVVEPDPKATVPFNKSKPGQCRWPLGEPAADMPICGMKTAIKRYCAYHYKMSIRERA